MGELVLPSALTDRPFTVREARAAGLRYDELRAAPLHAPTWAVRSLVEPGSLTARAAAFARGLPDDIAFSHVTAALLWRLPLPSHLEQNDADLDVIRDSAKERIRRRGCLGHRGQERRELVDLDGLRVVGLADTWVDLGAVAGRGLGLDDLVVAGDAVARQLDMQQVAEAVGAPLGVSLPGGSGTAVLGAALHAGSGREARPYSSRRCPSSVRARVQRWRPGPG